MHASYILTYLYAYVHTHTHTRTHTHTHKWKSWNSVGNPWSRSRYFSNHEYVYNLPQSGRYCNLDLRNEEFSLGRSTTYVTFKTYSNSRRAYSVKFWFHFIRLWIHDIYIWMYIYMSRLIKRLSVEITNRNADYWNVPVGIPEGFRLLS